MTWPSRCLKLRPMFAFACTVIITVLSVSALGAAPRGLIPGKQASPETIQLRKIEQPAPEQEPGWGQPIDGVSIRLRSDGTNWSTAQIPALMFDLQNWGARDL